MVAWKGICVVVDYTATAAKDNAAILSFQRIHLSFVELASLPSINVSIALSAGRQNKASKYITRRCAQERYRSSLVGDRRVAPRAKANIRFREATFSRKCNNSNASSFATKSQDVYSTCKSHHIRMQVTGQ